MHSILRPLAEAITILEGDTYPTLAWVAEIKKHVQNFQESTPNGGKFRDNLSDELDRLFSVFPDVGWMAALLTPSPRDSPALEGHRDNAWKLLKARYSEVELPTTAEQERVEERDKMQLTPHFKPSVPVIQNQSHVRRMSLKSSRDS